MPTTKTREQQFVHAKDPATGMLNGEPFVVNPSEIFASDHPIVRAHPHLFRPLEGSRQRPAVEQMTAGPGEVRGQS